MGPLAPSWIMRTSPSIPSLLLLSLTVMGSSLSATSTTWIQSKDTVRKATADSTPVRLMEITVTATRSPRSVFRVPTSAVVKDSTEIRERLGNGIADLFRNTPGLDVTGVGPNQGRISIRGQRGQRILMMENGVRMNNSRRQQDFGELPALVDPNALQRVEVIRGPASVLYGTDAIGGVVNFIPIDPPTSFGQSIRGSVSYRYSSNSRQHNPTFDAVGHVGRFGFAVNGSFRDADPYEAPAGSYGNITLTNDTKVLDSGVRDQNYTVRTSYRLGDRHIFKAGYVRYEADNAGFGSVSGASIGQVGAPTIGITYPNQVVNRFNVGYSGSGLGSPLADRLDVTAYSTSNRRDLNIDVFIPFGPTAGLTSASKNFTDLDTKGFRLEASKVIAGRHTLTYGTDFFRDVSFNTDANTTTISGFGPPMVDESNTPQVPNAVFKSVGAFVQGDLNLTDALNAVVGVRVQDVRAHTTTTVGITDPLVSSSDQTVVASANVSYAVSPDLTFIGTLGRAFRAPNLVERFFNGPTPEGSGFQVRNPDLNPETSVNVDLGVRVRRGSFHFEGFVFRNTISDGIRIEPTGTDVGPFPGFRNVNVEKIRDQGIEITTGLAFRNGVSVSGTYSKLDSENVLDQNNPVGDSYSSKLGGEATFHDPAGRFWLGYAVRHNGERSDVGLTDNPLGDVFPAFTVHAVRGGVRLIRSGGLTHSILFAVENLTNELYAEFSNAAFFRPEPKRMLVVSWRTGF